jgi:hypothetical protein
VLSIFAVSTPCVPKCSVVEMLLITAEDITVTCTGKLEARVEAWDRFATVSKSP